MPRRGLPGRVPLIACSRRVCLSVCEGFSEILLKKMVFCRRKASDCAVEDKRNFSTRSNRGFAVSREEKDQKNLPKEWTCRTYFRLQDQKNLLLIGKSAIPELNFVHEKLCFLHEMWPNEAAQKSRKVRLLRPSGRELCAKDSEKLKKKWAFRARFECNSPVRHG